MENAGLDDLWTESGLYATNTTASMLEGKAYYRAVRAHRLTYEALWTIKWPMFETWLQENDYMEDLDIKRLVQKVSGQFCKNARRAEVSNAVDDLTKALSDHQIQECLELFDNQNKENPNFQMWKAYMKMVEILLAFIRAEREGNWRLHLEAFTAMLPWLTIYDHTNYARCCPIYLSDMECLEKEAPQVYDELMSGNFVVKRSKRPFNQVSAKSRKCYPIHAIAQNASQVYQSQLTLIPRFDGV